MKKFRWLAILMVIAILAITGFQGYWLKNNYDREEQNLDIKTGAEFRQTILQLQASKLKLERMSFEFDPAAKPLSGKIVVQPGNKRRLPEPAEEHTKDSRITMMNLLQQKVRDMGGDTGDRKAFIFTGRDDPRLRLREIRDSLRALSHDTAGRPGITHEIELNDERTGSQLRINYNHKTGKFDTVTVNASDEMFFESPAPRTITEDIISQNLTPGERQKNAVIRFLYNIDSVSLKDSITISEATTGFSEKLKKEKVSGLAFSIARLDSTHINSSDPNEVTVGFSLPIVYGLKLDNKAAYILKKVTLPILFSIFLVGITFLSFVLLYRNMIRQRRLAELKNEFISNITHELKTPIATVGVAIEALKNFNALHDPQRTQEYLDISQNELQRLSLLVDKVLKLSMFEKKEMELKKEQFDCKELTEEVMRSMRLQFDKYHAKVKLHTEGNNFVVEADKLHITSVIYNLLDNALKYSRENPVIDVQLMSHPDHIEFSVSDNGIGIATAYKEKIFDKFFRVPMGDKHNVKGYGLGLSYVSEVLRRHDGQVYVESELGKGSTFTAKFPYT